MGAHAMVVEAKGRPKRSRYTPPSDVFRTDLRQILGMSNRGQLEAKQLNFLDQGEGASARPLTIWCAGDRELLRRPAIAVIGTRKVTEKGRKRANRFARELVERGVVVVSGLAAGVDATALSSAIRNNGSVIAVIGTPIDKAYPAQNAELQELIYRRHLLLTQFNVGERTFPSNFPARNRTMAAISDASVIIEASETSGTLHQAAECVRLGRWLGITRAVVDDETLTWPAKFLNYEKCIVLDDTADLLRRVYEGV
ncbi:hypothetical protein GCM10011494_02800 [Novosphingobium endophyticum]|uniref:Smf/DprA SLOG domain-containing protein n=1 Tax=Novosphingobium endophyticum TaxID=1955250 RepID=A0A916X313_9SPHN|nr:DNA-processing protein DprA [Novosphingobium endophyticum]GGB87896.1 hypothetical protein GCM10011494_02800 [Novosphingobium endophyticum]